MNTAPIVSRVWSFCTTLSLDLFWLKDESLTNLDDLPAPEDLAARIVEHLEAGLASFRKVLSDLQSWP